MRMKDLPQNSVHLVNSVFCFPHNPKTVEYAWVSKNLLAQRSMSLVWSILVSKHRKSRQQLVMCVMPTFRGMEDMLNHIFIGRLKYQKCIGTEVDKHITNLWNYLLSVFLGFTTANLGACLLSFLAACNTPNKQPLFIKV